MCQIITENISVCPICKNDKLCINKCIYKDKIIAYNIYCPKCSFTGRSFKSRHKALVKWNAMCVQVKHMADNLH